VPWARPGPAATARICLTDTPCAQQTRRPRVGGAHAPPPFPPGRRARRHHTGPNVWVPAPTDHIPRALRQRVARKVISGSRRRPQQCQAVRFDQAKTHKKSKGSRGGLLSETRAFSWFIRRAQQCQAVSFQGLPGGPMRAAKFSHFLTVRGGRDTHPLVILTQKHSLTTKFPIYRGHFRTIMTNLRRCVSL